MHQQPPQAPRLPNKSSSAGHSSGVSGRTANFSGAFARLAVPILPPRESRLTIDD